MFTVVHDLYLLSNPNKGWFSFVLFAIFLYPFGWAFAWQSWHSVIRFDNSFVPPLTTGIIWWHSNLFLEPHCWQVWLSRAKHSDLNVSQKSGRPFDVRSFSFIRSHFFALQMGEQVVIPLNFLPFEISPPQISHISKYRSLCLIQDSKTGLVISQRGSLSFHLSFVPLTGILNPKYIFMFTFYRIFLFWCYDPSVLSSDVFISRSICISMSLRPSSHPL